MIETLSTPELIDKIAITAKNIAINMNRTCVDRFYGYIDENKFGPIQWSQLDYQLKLVNELRKRNGRKPLAHPVIGRIHG